MPDRYVIWAVKSKLHDVHLCPLYTVVDALEASYPMLRGTIRGHDGGPRRAFIRFFACERDLSHDPPDDPLPGAVAAGTEPYLIVGAMAGG
jgi:sulfur-carrier protein